MYKYSRILVGLDHTEMDDKLIEVTSYISQLSGPKKVYFINIIKDVNLPENIQKEFPHLLEQAIEERKAELQQKIDQLFPIQSQSTSITVDVIVQEGQVGKAILSLAAKYAIDLIVLGRKNEKKNGGVLITRIARRAGCSLLIVPKGVPFKLDHIFVPSDFSMHSRLALEKACTWARRAFASKVTVQNVYQVPTGYHYTGKSFKEFAHIMQENAEKDYERFISEVNVSKINLHPIYTLDKEDDIITQIYRTARKQKANIIVIGAKGRTATSAFFIGSKAEKLIQVDSEMPVLVVRPKGKRSGFLDYIKEL